MLKLGPSFAALAALLALAASLAPTRGGPGRADAPEPIRVGVLLDLSGLTADFGVSLRNGVELAADHLNAAGGVKGRRVALVFRDDKGQPHLAATAAADLISREKVVALIGEIASSNSLAAAHRAQEAGVPMITPASTNPRVTQVGDYIFRACFPDPYQGELMARFAARTLRARRAAVLADMNSDYSRGLAKTFTGKFEALGGRITSKQTYTQTDRDFAAQLVAINQTKPDVIFVPGYYGEAGTIAKQAQQLGLRQPLLGGDGWDSPKLWQLGGDTLNGSYMTNHYALEESSPVNLKFVADYRGRYGRDPDAIAALGYDALGLLADAAGRAGTIQGARLRDAIAQTAGYDGVTGHIRIDGARDAVKPGVVFKLHDGKFVYHETITPD